MDQMAVSRVRSGVKTGKLRTSKCFPAPIADIQAVAATLMSTRPWAPIMPWQDLALQLPFCFEVRALSDRLVSSTPERPCDDMCGLDLLLSEFLRWRCGGLSWIDQRISDGVAVLLCLPWFGGAFFLAAADWRDGGLPPSWRRRASPGKRGDATHARICSRCDRVRNSLFAVSKLVSRSPTDGLSTATSVSDGCCCWTPGGEEGEITIGDMTTDQQTACPKTLICAAKFFRPRDRPDLGDSTNHAAAVLGSAPADRRFQSDERPRPGNVRSLAGDGSPLAPGMKYDERC